MKSVRCSCCGLDLQKGTLKYIIEIKSFADYDGFLEESDEDLEENINNLLDVMESVGEREIESDVYLESIYVLCKDCRERFVNDPFNAGLDLLTEEDVRGTVH